MNAAVLRPVEAVERPRDGFPVALDLRAMATRDPPPREWIVEGMIPRAANVLLSAHGGSGKTLLALHLAVCVATGKPFFGQATKQGKVVALFAEDDAAELHRRLAAVCAALDVRIADLDGRLLLFDGVGCDVSLFSRRSVGEDGRTYGLADPDTTLAFSFIEKACALHAADLAVLDSVSDCYDGDEISRPQVRRYLSRCLGMVLPRRGAVLHVGHVDKASARSGATGAQSYSGSTAWHNSVRARIALRTVRDDDGPGAPDDGRRELVVEKLNGGRPGLVLPIRYDEARHVFVPDGESGGSPLIAAIRERVEQRAILRGLLAVQDAGRSVMTSPRANLNAAAILAPMPGFPAGLRTAAGRKRLFRLLYQFEAEGLIEREAFRTASRNVAERWRVTPAGQADAGSGV